MAVELESGRPFLANVFGGLSGSAIKPIALRLVFQVAQKVKIPVIGGGGIMTGRDALEFLLVGARAVEVGTANLIDPQATLRIIREMEEYCLAHGLHKVEELVGAIILNDV